MELPVCHEASVAAPTTAAAAAQRRSSGAVAVARRRRDAREVLEDRSCERGQCAETTFSEIVNVSRTICKATYTLVHQTREAIIAWGATMRQRHGSGE